MSLILDALRKMEQDRSSRRGSAQDLRPEVLRYRRAPVAERRLPLRWISLAVLLVVVALGAGFLTLGSLRGKEVAIPASQAPAGEAPAAAVPTSPAPAAQPAAPEAAPAPGAAAGTVPEPARPPLAAGLKEVPAVAKESVPEPRPGKPERPVQPARRERPAPAAAPAQQPVMVGSGDITVSGIAWQDERNLRRAVLNGTLVGEGAQVAGARVVEIKEDRVRLSRNGQLFEVLLSSAAH
ncbi:hypothetical protein GMST_06570 [Geomonas silvestris]|uniref:Uncharacterized protein n=1 Tax=Geomonas silvestris TaxID=2740184 RepID=A0A6V8MEH9_9BACT|nr:hypothetical protein [Geomonas silvestris]GFO58332.1 hypothetical protein GMST_06570 [Geomonas silvestris]